jgi:hypothetical protein
MDEQAKILDMLIQARITIEAHHLIIRYEMLQTVVSAEMIEMFDQERITVLAELDKRIKAHPLCDYQN